MSGVIAETTAVRPLRREQEAGTLKAATRDHVAAAPDTDSLPIQTPAFEMPDL
jgi:hypothetical protein